MALVVFARGDDGAIIDKYTVLTDRMQFLGDALINTWFVAALPPGKYTFVVRGAHPKPLRAELAPGGVYYVSVWSAFRSWGGDSPHGSRFTNLFAAKKGTEHWDDVTQTMRDGEFLRPEATGQRALLDDRDVYAKLIEEAHEEIAGYDAEELTAHTLGPGDAH
jgi:hypothetical protein